MKPSTETRRGFTLVELLVVIAIIATLAAILTPAVMMAMDAANKAAIKLEIAKIEQGLETYKNKHNDYPPDFSDPAIVSRHFRKAFPKMAADEKAVLAYISDPNNVVIDRAEALVFALHGYSSDDTHPLTGPGGPLDGTDASSFSGTLVGSTGMTNSLIAFEEPKLTWALGASGTNYESTEGDSDVFPVYLQRGTDTPFVYFDSRSYVFADPGNSGTMTVNNYSDLNNSLAGVAQPYKTDQKNPKPAATEAAAWNALAAGGNPNTLKFANPDTFQIVAAGPDGKFSALVTSIQPADARVYPEGIGYKTEDLDNIVNFGDKSTLEGDMP